MIFIKYTVITGFLIPFHTMHTCLMCICTVDWHDIVNNCCLKMSPVTSCVVNWDCIS